MDFVQILLIICGAAGLVMVAVSFLKKSDAGDTDYRDGRYLETKLAAMDTTISEADSAITELGGMSRGVLKEIDQKYNELLFLYNLIDEKKKEIETVKLAEPAGKARYTEPDDFGLLPEDDLPDLPEPDDEYTEPPRDFTIKNPRYARILELKKQGMNAKDIARELGMGQGEVSLIMSISSNR